MPDPTDPFGRLGRLAPGVDIDAGAEAFTRSRAARARRRRTMTAGAFAAAAVLLVGIAAAVALPGDDDEHVRAGQSTDAPATTGMTAPVGLGQDERRTTTEDQGITLAMDTPLEATVGERMWVDLLLTNGRSSDITVGRVGGCNDPLGAVAGSISAINSLEAANEPVDFAASGSVDQSIPWDGDPDSLAAAFDGAQPPKVYRGRPEGAVLINGLACVSTIQPPTTVRAGTTLSMRIAIDLRGVDAASAAGELDVLGRTGPIEDASGDPVPSELGTRQPVTIVDPVDRGPSRAAATGPDGIVSAPTFDEWLAMTGDLGGQNVQTYQASLTWWQGAWEAWITPGGGTGHQADPLRIRFDPERNEVVDVRTVFWNGAPADDPDQPDQLPDPVDDVRYHQP
jgi:hypothetical protein